MTSSFQRLIAKSRQSRSGPESAMAPDQGREPIRLSAKIDCSKWNAGKRCSTPTAPPRQIGLLWRLGLADQSQSVTDDRRSSVFRSEPNTKMSAVAIAQTDNAPSKADLNTEFPSFLRGRSNQNADKNARCSHALGCKGDIT